MIGKYNVKCCSVILAGGLSTRMGTNKALLPLKNKLVIGHITEEMKLLSSKTVIISNDPGPYCFLGLPVIQDNYLDQGPLAGLEAALKRIEVDYFLVSACDTPFISKNVYQLLYSHLKEADAVVPIYQKKIHPLSGIYHKRIHSAIQHQLDAGHRKIKTLFENINVRYVENFHGISDKELEKHFFNMNDKSQYQQAKLL
ncbi:molybdenum cofactor guanylyltransferase [Virgibacillus flavescens]|uniref:molybdenum cofactor guanylyltransferase n=1 Tax=Virgibacillus flavescens TaxID=1611422 RepID=UPI003D34FED0